MDRQENKVMLEFAKNSTLVDIIGTIGVGKTTLMNKLKKSEEELGASFVYEIVKDNPWLEMFYAEMYYRELAIKDCDFSPTLRATPLMEIDLQIERSKKLCEASKKTSVVINDWGWPITFATTLKITGVLGKLDFGVFKKVYDITNIPPDIIIFVKGVDWAYGNRIKRNRDCEKNIKKDYLECLEKMYQAKIMEVSGAKVLEVNSEEVNGIKKIKKFIMENKKS